MKKKTTLWLIMIIGGVLITAYCYNNFFTESAIIGRYVNRNYDHEASLADIPHVADTLALLDNNRYESNFWGKGSYDITHDIKGTHIELIYGYEFGKGGFNTSISRLNWGGLKIILDGDRELYYEKITP
jgi:hypothetical protein